MSKLHLVFGGRVKDPRGLDFDMDSIDLVGIYDSYAAAEEAWRGKAQRSVDDAEMKYVVVHLHRLLDQSGQEAADVRRRGQQITLRPRQEPHHQLEYDPGDKQPHGVDPAIEPERSCELLRSPEAQGERSDYGADRSARAHHRDDAARIAEPLRQRSGICADDVKDDQAALAEHSLNRVAAPEKDHEVQR